MKKFLITFLIALFTLFNVNAKNATNPVVFDDEILEQVDSVYISVPAKLQIINTDAFKVIIKGNDDITIKCIKYEIIDGVLKITPVKTLSSDDMQSMDPENLKIRICTTKEIKDIKIGTPNGYKISYSNSKNDSGRSNN